jgi:hypothetical protein
VLGVFFPEGAKIEIGHEGYGTPLAMAAARLRLERRWIAWAAWVGLVPGLPISYQIRWATEPDAAG